MRRLILAIAILVMTPAFAWAPPYKGTMLRVSYGEPVIYFATTDACDLTREFIEANPSVINDGAIRFVECI